MHEVFIMYFKVLEYIFFLSFYGIFVQILMLI